jgi:UDP-3-O-[3-hydroxymyristoyl] glucosamine N-acyltransferase
VSLTLTQLAERIGAEVVGDGSVSVSGVSTLEDATAGQISFLANASYADQLETTKATAVIVGPKVACDRLILLKTKDPYFSFAQTVIALHGHRCHPHQNIHPRACVDPTASIGEGSVLYPGVYVGPRTVIGRNCILYPNAVLYDDCRIGDRVIVHSGASIGHDGFGFATNGGKHHKIPQVGIVVIEDDVEIGANSVISRAAMGSTVIAKGTKVDSLVSIGHGVKVGEHGLLVSQAGIAGSTVIGHHATFGGQVGVAGHLTIGNHVTIAAQGGVTNDVEDNAVLIGAPAMPYGHGKRVYVIFTKLPELLQRIQDLEQKTADLAGEKQK